MCNLWLLLYSTATSSAERIECKEGLDEAHNLLRLRANSFPLLRFAQLRVNSFFFFFFFFFFGRLGQSTRSSAKLKLLQQLLPHHIYVDSPAVVLRVSFWPVTTRHLSKLVTVSSSCCEFLELKANLTICAR
ncbi:hypothetical protein K431DRAFT_127018 [Polychaeton citri CBS 116435]|uniref:Secreted protein n=1 Tax=Polychaeton citri CBS 116435 TaxID=1314669 RepID=A0A9P4Q5F4_9PEZI|nr:hypothetical protein K431DRAFT_127018 [Polychaeton citri CBS 116435]